MRLLRAHLIAHLCIHTSRPLPLDVFATLNDAGIDVTEYERNIRNG